MKRIPLFLCLAAAVYAEELPPAPQILAAARSQLPPCPVFMSGTLKDRAANGFVRKTLNIEMTLDWQAGPPRAEYKISDPKTGSFQTLEIQWPPGSPVFHCQENGQPAMDFDPHSEIQNLGVTWSDLSFSFMWSRDARTLGLESAFGKERYQIAVPRPDDHTLMLWIEKETGRIVKAEEVDAAGKKIKIIKTASVKKFDDLWMVKDIDIIRPDTGEQVSLRIDEVRKTE